MDPQSPQGTPLSPDDPDLLAMKGPSRAPIWIGLAFVLGAALGGGAGLVLASITGGAAPEVEAEPTIAASPESEPEPKSEPDAAPPPRTLVQRAAAGEAEALKELEARPREERSAEETLALADGSRAAKLEELAELQRKIELLPTYGREKPGKSRIFELARDREVATDTLRMLSALPGDVGPDLLYELWTSTTRRNETTELAEALVYSKEVRAKASKALAVALALRETEECEKMAKVLDEAIAFGDRRSLAAIGKLQNKRGCGPKNRDDCWACLRDSDRVKDAVGAKAPGALSDRRRRARAPAIGVHSPSHVPRGQGPSPRRSVLGSCPLPRGSCRASPRGEGARHASRRHPRGLALARARRRQSSPRSPSR
jgi:hypothetical protein